MTKKIILIFGFFLFNGIIINESRAQDAGIAFHGAANTYIAGNLQEAKAQVMNALKTHPNDRKLNELLKKINKEEEEKKDQEKEKDKKEQEDKEKEKNEKGDKDKEDEEKEEGKKGEDEKKQEEKDSKSEESKEGEEQKTPQQSTADKLEEMNMSEEKAQMILEAMKNNEVQYIQQNKKKPQSRADDGKPDW